MNAQIVSLDPILPDTGSYRQLRTEYRATNADYFSDVIQRAALTDVLAEKFCNLLKHVLSELSSDDKDPYYSSVMLQWINGLSRGLELVSSGADGDCLRFYCNTDAFLKDLSLEYPSFAEEQGNHFYATIANSINLIPAQFMLDSPRMKTRMLDCLPEITNPDLFTRVDEQLLLEVKEHFDQALDLIYELSPDAYKLLQLNIHSIYTGVYEISKNSFGTRIDYPGCVIAAVSRERLEKHDIISTAAELYHEHCHLKLTLFCYALKIPLPKEFDLISPFKNENRDFETALHTVYTISIECYLRLLMLNKIDPDQQERAISFLAAMGYRLDIFREILIHNKAIELSDAFKKVPELCDFVLKQVFEKVASSPFARLHKREQQAILKRHGWDIGQFLSRGIHVNDPHLQGYERTDDEVTYKYRGKEYHAVPMKRKISNGNFGSHIDKYLQTSTEKI